MRVEVSKIEAVERIELPETKKEVRTFLGLTGYYRRFVPDYSTMAAPLTDMIRKTQPNQEEWTLEGVVSFERLKRALCAAPVLKTPNFTKEFVLQTDASDRGVGVVLSQQAEGGGDRPVAYFSKKLLPREQNYPTVEKECLAIKLAIQAFRVYLIDQPFIVQTDQRLLECLDWMKENNRWLTRWSLFLQPYTYTIRYRPGRGTGMLIPSLDSPDNPF